MELETTPFESADGSASVELTRSYQADTARKSALQVTRSGVEAGHYGGTTSQSWGYDGLGRVLLARDDNGPGLDGVVRYTYDSLGRVRTEGWDERVASHQWQLLTPIGRATGRRF